MFFKLCLNSNTAQSDIAMSNPTETFANVLRANAATETNLSNLNLILGENGCPEYSAEGVGDARVAMFSKLTRGVPPHKIDELVSLSLEQIQLQDNNISYIRDLFLILFEKRDCRGGEGEKTIFYHLFWRLVTEYPAHASAMINLFSEYGCWNDLFKVINYIRVYNKLAEFSSSCSELSMDSDSDSDSESYSRNVTGRSGLREQMFKSRQEPREFIKTLNISIETIKEFTDKIIQVVKNQWIEDIDLMAENKSISLLAKWLPTERSEFAKHNYVVWKRLVDVLSKCIASDSEQAERIYRIQTVAMRKYIDIVEAHMCNGSWSEINPEQVPSVCAQKHKKAFLNELTTSQAEQLGRTSRLIGNENITGNRYPNSEDRVNMRLKWLEAIANKKVKGSQLSPDMLVIAAINATTESEKALINAQWNDLKASVQAKIIKARQEGFEPMDNIIPMIDLSPSMDSNGFHSRRRSTTATTPKMAAIGLGLMLSEINSGPCQDLLITFDSECNIVDLRNPECNTFTKKVNKILELLEGFSTNFYLAITRICELVRVNKLPEDSIPALCILSDEQFDHHQFGYDKTMENRMCQMFHDVGMEISGVPYSKPRTVHWNLRGNTEGFPATADSRNVQMIAGYSAALFDLILCGKPEPTPFETMRRKLDSARYQLVRDAFDSV